MARHPAGIVSLEAPQDWTAAATARFYAPPPQAQTERPQASSSFHVSREPATEGQSVDERARRAMLQIARSSSSTFELVESRETTVGGRPAVLKHFRFGLRPRIDQILVMVDPGTDPDRQVTVFAFTATGESARQDAAAFERMLQSVRFS
jgi:hypothetical protein